LGPDGNLWFQAGDRVGRVSSTGTIAEFVLTGERPARTIASADGALWYAGPSRGLGRATVGGTIFEKTSTRASVVLVAGRGENLWYGGFPDISRDPPLAVRLIGETEVDAFPLPMPAGPLVTSLLAQPAVAADGTLWLASTSSIFSVTASGE